MDLSKRMNCQDRSDRARACLLELKAIVDWETQLAIESGNQQAANERVSRNQRRLELVDELRGLKFTCESAGIVGSRPELICLMKELFGVGECDKAAGLQAGKIPPSSVTKGDPDSVDVVV